MPADHQPAGQEVIARLRGLVPEDPAGDEDAEGPALLAMVKAGAGDVSLETMLTEVTKLRAVRTIGLPPGLFDDVEPKVVTGWRLRAAVESPPTCAPTPSRYA